VLGQVAAVGDRLAVVLQQVKVDAVGRRQRRQRFRQRAADLRFGFGFSPASVQTSPVSSSVRGSKSSTNSRLPPASTVG
jgi:hypothetical protein